MDLWFRHTKVTEKVDLVLPRKIRIKFKILRVICDLLRLPQFLPK